MKRYSGNSSSIGTATHPIKISSLMGDNHSDSSKKSRYKCVYYEYETRDCKALHIGCVGPSNAFCKKYCEKGEQRSEAANKAAELKHIVRPFEGIQLIPMDKITARKKDFKPPSPEKAKKLREYYREHGELDKPVVVVIENGRYIVVDKYLRYFVAQQMQLKMVHAVMRQGQESLQEILHTVGRKVVHNTFGEGVIKKVELNFVYIEFSQGKTVPLDIETCIKNKYIKPL